MADAGQHAATWPDSARSRSLLGLDASDRAARRGLVHAALRLGVAATDVALIIAAGLAAALARYAMPTSENTAALLTAVIPPYLLAAALIDSYGIERMRRAAGSAGRALTALAIAAGCTLATAFAFKTGHILSRLETGYLFALAAVLLVGERLIVRAILNANAERLGIRTLVISDGSLALGEQDPRLTRMLDVNRLGWSPRGDDPGMLERIMAGLGAADRIVLAFSRPEDRRDWSNIMKLSGVEAEILEPELAPLSPTAVRAFAGTPTLVVSRRALTLPERAAKRALDLAVVIALMPVIGPLIGILALLVRLESPGPAFFVQRRVGRNNRQFPCYKLRTMRHERSDSDGRRSTARDDDRVTPLGRFLRRTSLDELPQLFNVLRGDMSLVGPRPHALGSQAEGDLFWEIMPDYWSRHAIKPGVTGLAQVRGLRGTTETREQLIRRVEADLEYISTWSLWLDIKILLRTLFVIMHRNAY